MLRQIVDPQLVVGTKDGFDYDRLITEFGMEYISSELIHRIEHVTCKKVNHMIRRGLIYAHVDLNKIIDAYEQHLPIYIYTGRGPSAPHLHLGHIVPLLLTKHLQELFNALVIIQISDDEKLYYKHDLNEEEVEFNTHENIKDIIALGFDPKLTYIFQNSKNIGMLYPMISKMMRMVNINQLNHIYGFDINSNPGQVIWPLIQSAPAFAKTFDHIFHNENTLCLIPAAVDQAPYFRMARDLASRMKLPKPTMILGQFLPALEGISSKMSSSVKEIQPIYITDSANIVKKKIGKAFSGGKNTKELQQIYGANIDIDVAYQYLRFFEEDDLVLDDIKERYSKGQMMSGEVKGYLIGKINTFLKKINDYRNSLTMDIINEFLICK